MVLGDGDLYRGIWCWVMVIFTEVYGGVLGVIFTEVYGGVLGVIFTEVYGGMLGVIFTEVYGVGCWVMGDGNLD